jgi:hypothetical protein
MILAALLLFAQLQLMNGHRHDLIDANQDHQWIYINARNAEVKVVRCGYLNGNPDAKMPSDGPKLSFAKSYCDDHYEFVVLGQKLFLWQEGQYKFARWLDPEKATFDQIWDAQYGPQIREFTYGVH